VTISNGKSRREAYVVGINRAFLRAVQAAQNGEPRTACPYKRGDHQKCWTDGWAKGSQIKVRS
jgi:ribosome modulation factor